MLNYPDILLNPSGNSYNLKSNEIYLLKEIAELVELNRYSYCVLSLWQCTLVNIQRRIEFFGIQNLKAIIEDKDTYDEMPEKRRDRWHNVNEYRTIEYAQKLHLIPELSLHLVKMLYWLKNEVAQNEKIIDQNELYSVITLLEKELFLIKFKEDQRISNDSNNNLNRREEDTNIGVLKNTKTNASIEFFIPEDKVIQRNRLFLFTVIV